LQGYPFKEALQFKRPSSRLFQAASSQSHGSADSHHCWFIRLGQIFLSRSFFKPLMCRLSAPNGPLLPPLWYRPNVSLSQFLSFLLPIPVSAAVFPQERPKDLDDLSYAAAWALPQASHFPSILQKAFSPCNPRLIFFVFSFFDDDLGQMPPIYWFSLNWRHPSPLMFSLKFLEWSSPFYCPQGVTGRFYAPTPVVILLLGLNLPPSYLFVGFRVKPFNYCS